MKQYVDTGNGDVETPSRGRGLRVPKPNMLYDDDSENDQQAPPDSPVSKPREV